MEKVLEKSDLDWLDEPPALPVKDKRTVKVAARKPKKRPPELIKAERALTMQQRLYLRWILETNTLAEADRRMKQAGYPADRSTLWRWRNKPEFIEALELMRDWQFKAAGFSKNKVLLDAEKIKEMALTPKPVLYKGEATGYDEVDLGAALRAAELQGKGLGLMDREQHGVVVNVDIDFSGRADVIIEGESETLAVE